MTIAVYIIKSKAKNTRVYIGSSCSFEKRKREHINKLRKNNHHSPKLQRHFNKYGLSDLEISTLIELESADDLLMHEQINIDKFNPYFNCCKIAGNTKGFKHSDETRKKMSLSKIGIRQHEFTEETRKKMSDARKGIVIKDITRKKMSHARLGSRNHNYGKKHSEDVLKKMSEAKKGKKMSEDTKLKHKHNMIGNAYTKRRAVINIKTNKKYLKIIDAAKDNKINVSTLQAMLSGRNPNKTDLRYL